MRLVVDQDMNLRTMSFALAALMGTAGCVSVQAEAERPAAPVSSAHSADAPVTRASTPPTAPPAVHDALGKGEEQPGRPSGKERPEKKEEGVRAPARPAGAGAPPARQEARSRPRPVTPARPEPPRRAQPRQTYDMRTVCARGQGVASAEIVDLCRTTYGR
ncbi:hypothetical protein ABT001_18630 [Streptomyces sp. NPDC002793]|uniref:hypothetical protein n=1 Tax=Streptomyces sp. NPDC002793 TaxID=3154432 RepID=UPI003325B357